MRGAWFISLVCCAVALPFGLDAACAQDRLRPAADDTALSDDSDETTDEAASGEPDAGAVDGDLSRDGLDPQLLLRDGLMDDAETAAAADGADGDVRAAEDSGLFSVPDARNDPLLFQIEDFDPVGLSDRRPARLARLEPFDPLGIRVGTFVLFPEVEAAGLWTSNAQQGPPRRSDGAAEVKPAARLVSDWNRHALELRGAADLSYFDTFDSENDRGTLAEARGRLDITRRSNLQGVASHEITQESRSAIDADQSGARVDIAVSRAGLAFSQRFNRLQMQLRGALADIDYGDSATANNDDRDVRTSEQAVRASWEFKPTLTAFVDTAVNQRDYATAASDGLRRSSRGERLRAGFDVGNGPVWRGEISVGWGRQDADAAELGSTDGFLFDANFAWRPTALTSILLTAQSEIDDTVTTGAAFAVTRSGSVEVRHALRRHLVLSAGTAYLDREIDGTGISEDEWRTSLGIDYFLGREIIVFGRYQHIAFHSTQADADWTADDVRVGVKVRR